MHWLHCCWGGLTACTGFVSDDAQRPGEVSRALDDWSESRFLTDEQRGALYELRAETQQAGGAFAAVVWEQGHAVLDLQVRVPSSLGQPGSLADHATAFLAKYGTLWNVTGEDLGGRLQVVAVRELGDCSFADVQLHTEGLPVFNATLRLTMTPDGVVRRVSGLMNAAPLSFEVTRAQVSAAEAARTAVLEAGWGSDAAAHLPAASLVVFDPFFVAGGEHAPAEAWLFRAEDATPNDGLLASGQTGSLLTHGPSFEALQVFGKVNECDEETPPGNAWLAQVVVDSLTQTPAWVSFTHFGGLRIDAVSDLERAYQLMGFTPMRRMYGDAAPRDHLALKSRFVESGRTTLTFEQRFLGHRVDGAYLQVSMEGNRVMEVFSRLPWFPAFDADGLTDQATAEDHARQWYIPYRCMGDASCLADPGHTASSRETVVFSTELFDEPGMTTSHELAYRFEFEAATVWWSAKRDAIIRMQPRTRGLVPVSIWSEGTPITRDCSACFRGQCGQCLTRVDDAIQSPPYRLEINQSGLEFPPLHPDAWSARTWMLALEPKLSSTFGWHAVLGDGGVHPYSPNSSIDVIVGAARDDGGGAYAGWSATDDPAQPTGSRYSGRLEMGVEVASRDVLAHEYAHLITEHAYSPLSGLEQGALSESYSDVIGAALFPAPAPHHPWDFASESRRGVIRNMLNPTSPSTPSGQFAIDHVSQKARCDPANADCTYPWLGIPDRAAALIAQGVPQPVPGTTPLGRDTMARLYFETIRNPAGGPFQMQSVDRFLNQRVRILAVCQLAAAQPMGPSAQRWTPTRTITADDCQNIAGAFDAVGVVAAQSNGFDRFNTYRSRPWSQTIWVGSRLYNGCTISGHTLNVELRREPTVLIHLSRSASDTPPLFVTALNGEVTAQVTARCGGSSAASCPNATDREVTYTVDSKWDWPGDSSPSKWNVWVEEQQNVPQGLDPRNCLQPSNAERVLYWSSPIVHTGSALFVGKREARLLSNHGSPFSPGNCDLLEIAGIDSHVDGLAPNILNQGWTTSFSHGNHGFGVTYLGTNGPRDYTAELGTWADGFSGIYARVLYWLARPPGVNCAFPGMSEVPPELWQRP